MEKAGEMRAYEKAEDLLEYKRCQLSGPAGNGGNITKRHTRFGKS